MKVLIAGATGVLGRRLVQQLRDRNHTAIALVRSAKGEQIVQSLGADSCWVDIFDAEAIARAASGVDVVIHAATSIPVKNRTTPADWEMNARLRRAGTQALTTAAAKVGARLYIQQSVIWVARPDDGSFFDETTRSNPHPIVRSALDVKSLLGKQAHITASTFPCCGVAHSMVPMLPILNSSPKD